MQKQKRGFWLFIFSLIPGAGEMYMGFKKQGISIMFLFWGIFAIGAPGVPGGTVMASLGIITGILKFDSSGTALMLTIFALQDSFGTTTSTEGPEAGNESNSNYVQDGSYLRMQTLTLGYSLPKKLLKKIGFEKIRVYGQISNVFTITGYDGLDPEVRSHTSFENEYVSSDMNKGIDYGSYGMPRQFLMGVNVTF